MAIGRLWLSTVTVTPIANGGELRHRVPLRSVLRFLEVVVCVFVLCGSSCMPPVYSDALFGAPVNLRHDKQDLDGLWCTRSDFGEPICRMVTVLDPIAGLLAVQSPLNGKPSAPSPATLLQLRNLGVPVTVGNYFLAFEEDSKLEGRFAWALVHQLDGALALVHFPRTDGYERFISNGLLSGSVVAERGGRSALLDHDFGKDILSPPKRITLERITDADCKLIYERRFELYDFDQPRVVERIWPRRHAPLLTIDQVIEHDHRINSFPLGRLDR